MQWEELFKLEDGRLSGSHGHERQHLDQVCENKEAVAFVYFVGHEADYST